MAIERCAAAAGEAPPAPPAAPPVRHTRVITIEHAEHHDSTLYRLEKGCYLQFSPGPTLLGRKVFLYTNYVVSDSDDEKSESAEFVRNQYYGLEWRRGEGDELAGAGSGAGAGEPLGAGVLVTDADVYCEIKLARAGSFHYYFVYDNAESAIGPQGSGWFQVPPRLAVGAGAGERLPLDGLACQTVLAKCLGPLPRWRDTLRVAHEAGYNMIHFTPIQELGASNSSYSIADQLRLNPQFSADTGREHTFADVENLVAYMRTEWKMVSICDIVLNHTANETSWLRARPEASYNCGNSPHLRPAALLDAALARFSHHVAQGLHAGRGVPSRLTEHHQLEALRRALETHVAELRLHELYTCDVSDLVQQFHCLARHK